MMSCLLLCAEGLIARNSKVAMSDNWSSLPDPVPDVVFALDAKAKAASDPKINLIIGAYRDENGKPMPLKSVRKAEKILLDMNLNYEYQPIAGDQDFCTEAVKLLYGDKMPERSTVAAVQTLSGTGACRLAADFFARTLPVATTSVYLSDPTWANHPAIFRAAGFASVKTYRYFCAKTRGVDIEAMLQDIASAPERSVIVLHLCAHNPTGADPTPDEWKRIADVIEQRKHFTLFDSAYQGYASGDLNRDAYAARLFLERRMEFCVAQSFAKNMGLYNERLGCLSFKCNHAKAATKVFGLLQNIIRAAYSNPPAHGARIAKLVLTNPQLRAEWESEMRDMSSRIIRMRTILRDELVRLKTPGTWDHITKQIGMFSYLGLSKEQCQKLQDRRMFVMLTGRASIAGLTTSSAKLLASGIDEVVRSSAVNGSKL